MRIILKVYTSNIKIEDEDALDITVKSGDKVFAPTWNMVMGYKKGKISKEEYTKEYISMMRKSYVVNKSRWKEVLNMDRVVFQCYCKAGDFCHRILLARCFNKIEGATYKGEIEDKEGDDCPRCGSKLAKVRGVESGDWNGRFYFTALKCKCGYKKILSRNNIELGSNIDPARPYDLPYKTEDY